MPVLTIIPEMAGDRPSPCSYIRLLNPLLTRKSQEHFCLRVGTPAYADLRKSDIVVTNRIPCNTLKELDVFLSRIRQNDVRLVYELDDDLLNLDPDHPEKQLYKEREEIVRKLLVNADLVWVSTDELEESVRPLVQRVQILENFIDPLLLDIDESRELAAGTFRILYMGTKTHSADLSIVLEPLRKLHVQGAKFELILIGVTPNVPKESWIKNVIPPYSSYPLFMQWLRTLPKFDLGIAPLQATNFNRCKSPIKYWDYTAMGVPTLASRFGAYEKMIVDGQTGLLANNNDDDWSSKIRLAMENRTRLPEILRLTAERLRKRAYELDGSERRRKALLELLNGA